MTRSACLAAASAYALAVLFHVGSADAQNAADGSKNANPVVEVASLSGQNDRVRTEFSSSRLLLGVAIAQAVSAELASNEPQARVQSAKVEVEGDAKIAGQTSEQKEAARANQGASGAGVKREATQPPADAKQPPKVEPNSSADEARTRDKGASQAAAVANAADQVRVVSVTSSISSSRLAAQPGPLNEERAEVLRGPQGILAYNVYGRHYGAEASDVAACPNARPD